MGSPEQVADLTKGLSKFALDFYHECVLSKRGNVVISPITVASALSLLAQGADGNTFEELRKVLHLTGDKATIANQFAAFYKLLQQTIGQSTLSIINKIYVQIGHQINKHFKEVAMTKFSSGIESLDFANGSKSAQTINSFVEKKSNEKIKNAIAPAELNFTTSVVLVNAIYFKGTWEHPFDKNDTFKGDFYTNDFNSVPVDFMRMLYRKFNYAKLEDLDATALEMRYANSELSFVIVLPNSRTGLSALENKLKQYDLAQIINRFHYKEIWITIPKFQIEFDINLNDVLSKMGITEMFTDRADLIGLSESKDTLHVSNVVHKAFIEVNEDSCEAAANNWMNATICIQPTFYADHSFLYYIMDTAKMIPILIGSFKNIE